MKNRLQQLLRGTIEYPVPKLSFGTECLNGTLLPGKKMSVDVNVTSENGVPMHLFFYSQNARVKVLQPQASGRNCRLTLEISTIGCIPTDTVTGSIDVIYNGGEMKLPYEFKIGMIGSEAMPASFSTLEEFAEFARKDFQRAVHFFAWKGFTQMPFMENLTLQGSWHLYYTPAADDAGLSQFLAAAGFTEFLKKESSAKKTDRVYAPDRAGSFASNETKKEYMIIGLLIRLEHQLRCKAAVGEDLTQEFDALLKNYPNDCAVRLLYIYFHVQTGSFAIAREELLHMQDQIQKERMERRDFYCLYIWLAGKIQQDTERQEQAWKLAHKYYMDGTQTLLMYYLEYRMNPDYREDPARAYAYLRQCRNKGVESALFTEECCLLYRKSVSYISTLTDFELRCMLYGLRHRMLSEKRLFELLSREMKNPRSLNLYMLVLKLGFEIYGNRELLMAVVNVYLQAHRYGLRYFRWYSEAVSRGISMPGLYEYYLASLPKNFDERIPEEIIRYFGLGDENTSIPLDILYSNVCEKYADDPEITEMYEEKIRQFAFRKIKAEEYSVRMLPIFSRVLNEQNLSEETAEALLGLFYLRRVHTTLENAKNAAVYYPQLEKSASFPFHNGDAVVPVFSKKCIFAVEDGHGRIHYDGSLSVSVIYEDERLRKQCSLYVKNTLLTELAEADRILDSGIRNEGDLYVITDLIKNRRIQDFYRARLYEAVIQFSVMPDMQYIDCSEFLLDADIAKLSPAYRGKYMAVLIKRGLYREVFERVLEYGFEQVDDASLTKLAEHMMKFPVVQGDRTMLAICCRLYRNQTATTAIYTFMAAYFNGSAADMTAILKILRKRRQPVCELTERTLTECFFVNQLRDIDSLFEIYMNENRQDEQLVKAYLILRSHDYFMAHRKLTETCVRELEKSAMLLPRVCCLAALTYLAENIDTLNDNEKMLASQLLGRSVEENMVLGCFNSFAGKIMMPAELEGRAFVEYRSEESVADAAAVGFILPVRKAFHRTLVQVYPGVFTRSFILYRREWLKYYFAIRMKSGEVHEEEGPVIAMETGPLNRGSRYEDIAHLENAARRTDTAAMELVKSLVLKERMTDDIFGV